MGRLSGREFAVLERLGAADPAAAGHETWVAVDWDGPDGRALKVLCEAGLCEAPGVPAARSPGGSGEPAGAPRPGRGRGGPAGRVRLTAQGRDVLVFAGSPRARYAPAARQAGAGWEEVLLQPAEMHTVQRYLAVAGELSRPTAPGFTEAFGDARFVPGRNRWQVLLTAQQVRSLAYLFHLESFAEDVRAANRLSRTYEIVHVPD